MLSVQGHSGVIWCTSDFSYFRQPSISDKAGRRVKRTWASGPVLSVHSVLLTVKGSKSFEVILCISDF